MIKTISFIGLITQAVFACQQLPEEQFRRGMVTIQTDDGIAAQTVLAEMLKKLKMPSAFYVNSNERRLNSTRYMSELELQEIKNNDKWRLSMENHSKSHLRLSEVCNVLDYSEMDEEINHTVNFLKDNLNERVQSYHLAAPFGAINECVREYAINSPYVKSLRGVQRGLNPRNGDKWNMKAYSVDERRSLQLFYDLIDQAIEQKQWLQLYWHNIFDDCNGLSFCYSTQNTQSILDYIQSKRSQIAVVSQDIGVNLMSSNPVWDRLGAQAQERLKCKFADFFNRGLKQTSDQYSGEQSLNYVDETQFEEKLGVQIEELQIEFMEDKYCYINVIDSYDTYEGFVREFCLKTNQPLLLLDNTPVDSNTILEPEITILKYKCVPDYEGEFKESPYQNMDCFNEFSF